MKILVVTVCRNEERIIPYFIRHYAKIADTIILVDNHSTDNTLPLAIELSNKHNVQLGLVKTENKGFSESVKKNIFDNLYKAPGIRENNDVVIVVDTDEFFYHPKGTRQEIEKLYNIHGSKTVIKPHGYQMFSDTFPTDLETSIIQQVKTGYRHTGLDKACCFSTNVNLNAGFGMHVSWHFDNNNNELPEIEDQGFLLLHYKFLGFNHRFERVMSMKNNLSPLGSLELEYGINGQLNGTEKGLREEYEAVKNLSHLINYEELGYEDV